MLSVSQVKKQEYQKVLFSICLGVLTGACLTFNLWIFYFFATVIFCIIWIKKAFIDNESRFLIKLFLLSLFLRIFAVMITRPFVILLSNGLDIFGDGMACVINGFVISETIKGSLNDINSKILLNKQIFQFISLHHLQGWTGKFWALDSWAGSLPRINTYQVGGFGYFLSMLYYFFGFSPLTGIFVNCLLGSSLCLPVYSITNKILNNRIMAKFSAVFISFFPSLFLWSIVNLKEIFSISFNLLIILCIFMIVTEHKKIPLYLFFILTLTLLQLAMRPQFIPLLLIYYLLIFIIFGIRRKRWVFLFLIFLFSFMCLFPKSRNFMNRSFLTTTEMLHRRIILALKAHGGHVSKGGSYYKILNEPYPKIKDGSYYKTFFDGMTSKDIAKAYFLGMVHFIFEPFSRETNNFSKLIAYPQTMLCYFLLLFFFIGLFVSARHNFPAFLVLFLYLFIFSSSIALQEGNVGSLVRHRDIVTPIFIVFSSIGLVNSLGLLRRKKGVENYA